jgi:hypothetical protein
MEDEEVVREAMAEVEACLTDPKLAARIEVDEK